MHRSSLALSLGLVITALIQAGCGSSDNGAGGTTGGGATSSTSTPPAGGGTSSGGATLTAAGSTFVDPAMTKWVEAYKAVDKDASINYQALGSGAGLSHLKDGTVDFACADFPLDDKAMGEMPSPVTQIPITSGCVAVVYNVTGVTAALKLSGDVLADIFLGKITKWNDPAIVKDNAGVTLPDLAISVAHRSDGSGTTYIFTDYLSAISPNWKSGPGKNKDIKWPAGIGGKGSAGVAGLVKQTPGGIGYVELAYATQNKMPVAQIKNSAGKFVEPTLESTAAASAAFSDQLGKDLRTSIVNTSAADGYPIAGFTYAMLLKTPKDAAKGKAVVQFLNYVLTSGQDAAKALQYAPIPPAVATADKAQLEAK